jgi:MFS family permease
MMDRSASLGASYSRYKKHIRVINAGVGLGAMGSLGLIGGGPFLAAGLIQAPFSYSQAIVLWLIAAGGVLLFLLLLLYFRRKLPPRYQMMLKKETQRGGESHDQMGA